MECSLRGIYGALWCLNKVSEVEDHFFHAGADSWYPISLEILTSGQGLVWIMKILNKPVFYFPI